MTGPEADGTGPYVKQLEQSLSMPIHGESGSRGRACGHSFTANVTCAALQNKEWVCLCAPVCVQSISLLQLELMAFVNICLTVKRSVDVGVDETIICLC